MRILSNRLALLAAATIALVSVSAVSAADEAKETTLKGTMQCAKCSLKEAGVSACTDVLTVKEGDKSVNYYITEKGSAKTASHVCAGKKEDISVTGVVAEKDGKHTVAATKIEAAK